MIVVIQCAARKRTQAGHLRTLDGKKVMFVADPDTAPNREGIAYAHPDGFYDTGKTWRTVLLRYNGQRGANPYGLLPAWQLYENPAYGMLADRFGPDRLYILSAGWGLIPARFLTPSYDITFSTAPNVAPFKRRARRAEYHDFRLLPPDTTDSVVFFGGKAYAAFFCNLTQHVNARRYLFYNSIRPAAAPGCVLQRFHTKTRTNWHYECASPFAAGRLQLDGV